MRPLSKGMNNITLIGQMITGVGKGQIISSSNVLDRVCPPQRYYELGMTFDGKMDLYSFGVLGHSPVLLGT
jgi:hypothetical protein